MKKSFQMIKKYFNKFKLSSYNKIRNLFNIKK